MKILHTSDWHLGKKLGNFSRMSEQKDVIPEICQIAEEKDVDVVLIAGDVFDTFNPAVEALELFYQSIRRLSQNGKRAVIVIAGNHDSPDRIEAPDPLARYQGIFFAGYPGSIIPETHNPKGVSLSRSEAGFAELKHPGWDAPLRLLLTPYASEYRLKCLLQHEDKDEAMRILLEKNWNALAEKYLDNQGINLLVSHLFFMKKGAKKPEEPSEGEKPVLHPGGVSEIFTHAIPPQVQYAALGHLHRYQQIDEKVFYCGSPMAYSFSEAMQKKYINIIELKAGKPAQTEAVEIKNGKTLIRKKCLSVDEAAQWLSEHQDYLVELVISTEKYLTAEDRKRLNAVHAGIIQLIPEILEKETTGQQALSIDPGGDISKLFAQYFKSAKGQEPNEEILSLFNEISEKHS